MGDRQARATWRAAFLRELARGGSVMGAARVAGVDKGTAYDHRKRDAAFADAWEAAKLGAQRGLAAGVAPVLGPHEVVRASRAGRPCVVRAGPGRWSAGSERTFLEELATDANVTRAAAAAGVSTTAVYVRRDKWPGFAERWDRALAQGYAQLEALLIHSATTTLSGASPLGTLSGATSSGTLSGATPTGTLSGAALAGEAVEAAGAPRCAPPSFAEAFALFRFHRHAVTGDGKRPRHDWRRSEPSIEDVRAEVLRRVKALGG